MSRNYLIILLLIVIIGCAVKSPKKTLVYPQNIENLDKKSAYLKAHMKNGDLYILSEWSANEKENSVSGYGRWLNPNRELIKEEHFLLSIDSVALFETNVIQQSGSVAALSIMTGITLSFTIYCISNPKACFGSCPTFYTEIDGNEEIIAEGFSSSVTPSLERADIDALPFVRPESDLLTITMKNEALETHVVRTVELIAVPRESGRVYYDKKGNYYLSNDFITPSKAIADNGDITNLIETLDGVERISLSDSSDLATKESIDLHFNRFSHDNIGIVIGCRQSLLSTYLFYQTLSFLGKDCARWIAALENMGRSYTQDISVVGQQLGGIDVLVPDSLGKFNVAGTINETGPLATDLHLLRLPVTLQDRSIIRLRMAKGNFRIDYIALVSIDGIKKPLMIPPVKVISNNRLDNALELLTNNAKQLVSMPGDEYHLIFKLPDDPDRYEYFLYSKGYYLEWIRDEWLKDENPEMATMIFLNPEQALKILAPSYKEIESEMEEIFWSSKYGK